MAILFDNWHRAIRKRESDFFFTLRRELPKNFHTHHRLYKTKVVFPQSFGPNIPLAAVDFCI